MEPQVYLDASPLISENFGPLVFLGIYDIRNLPYMMECIFCYMDSPAKSSTNSDTFVPHPHSVLH